MITARAPHSTMSPLQIARPLGDRPSPPDLGDIVTATRAHFPARPGFNDPYTVDDQQQVISAALTGGRTGAELVTAAFAVKSAMPARPGWNDPYSKTQQLTVITTALASWYELDSIGDRISSVQSAMPARPGWNDPYTTSNQVETIVSMYAQPFRMPGSQAPAA